MRKYQYSGESPVWVATIAPATTTPEQWAWAAGLFEGEGCIYIDPSGRSALIIQMTDRDVLEKFHTIVGVGSVKPVPVHRGWKENWKPQFCWRTGSYADLLMLAEKFRPWLCSRRLEKLENALEHRPRPHFGPYWSHCKRGHPLSGDGSDVRVVTKFGKLQRVCRICRREARQAVFAKRESKADAEI